MRTIEELATLAMDIAFKLHRTLGPGLMETVYEAAFAIELQERKISFTKQQQIPVIYEGRNLGVGFRADIIIDGRLLIEIKSVQEVRKVMHKITLNYMKLTDIRLGFIFNFNGHLMKDGIYRKVNGYAGEDYKSAQ